MFTFWQRKSAGPIVLGCIAILSFPAYAWELSIGGQFTWEIYQFSQLSSQGFFGLFDPDMAVAKSCNRTGRVVERWWESFE